MSFKLRRIAASVFDGVAWLFLALAKGCGWLADQAEDAAVGLRR